MARAFIVLLDSFGIGASRDAAQYGDAGADTFRHIAEYCYLGKANQSGVRSGPLHIPNLLRLGLHEAAIVSQGAAIAGLPRVAVTDAAYGCAEECSLGKDTPSGHWEIAGFPVTFDWGYFPPEYPSFPDDLLEDLMTRGKLPGVLGNRHASGTQIIDEFGEEHERSGKPIVYTSGDSVFQIAAHEKSFGLERLYQLCKIARELVDEYNVGRVIARPFIGTPGHYKRTGNRHDYATPPPEQTLLDHVVAASGKVIAIGKVSDIFAHRGISETLTADGNQKLIDQLIAVSETAEDKSLIFANLVDFDTLYGHRRDVAGYAKALEDFDARIPELEAKLRSDDLVIITADHGCDPTWPGSDHTREHIPILAFGGAAKPGNLGKRKTFADIGQTIAKHLGVAPTKAGVMFWE